MDKIKNDLKLTHIHVHLGLIFTKKRFKPILWFLTPGLYIAHKLSVDPLWQFKFNAFFSVLWLISMVIIPFIPFLWGNSVAALIIVEVSLWANFASHFGALGANLSSIISDNQIKNPK